MSEPSAWNRRTITRRSIEPTYDSRETGPRYHVSSTVDGRPVAFMEPIQDPFVNHTIQDEAAESDHSGGAA